MFMDATHTNTETNMTTAARYLAESLATITFLAQLDAVQASECAPVAVQAKASPMNDTLPAAPIFLWNGIKDSKGAPLQKAHYSHTKEWSPCAGRIIPEHVTIYGDRYSCSFSALVALHFDIRNDSDTQADYFCKDQITVYPSHPLYGAVMAALAAQDAHREKMSAKRDAKRAARRMAH